MSDGEGRIATKNHEKSRREWQKDVLYVGLLALAVVLVFWEPLTTSLALQASDTDLVGIRRGKAVYPSTMLGSWRTDILLGRPGSPSPFSLQRFLMKLFHPVGYVKLAYALNTLALGVILYAWLRFKRIRPFCAFCGGVALALAGHSFTLVAAGHMGKFAMFPYVLLSLLCFDMALSGKSFVLYAAAGACMALGLAEQPDVALMLGMLIAAYCVFRVVAGAILARAERRLPVQIAGMVVAAVAFFCVGAPFILGQYRQQVAGVSQGASRTPEQKWEWATQWSFPPEDTLELVAPTVFGIKSHDSRGPYWGRQGRSPQWGATRQGFRNFRQEGQYMSGLVLGFAILGAVAGARRRRRGGVPTGFGRGEVWFWIGAAAITYLLALGKYGPLYRLFYALPRMSAMRNPVKFLYAFEICVVLLFAYGLHSFLEFVGRDGEGNGHEKSRKDAKRGRPGDVSGR